MLTSAIKTDNATAKARPTTYRFICTPLRKFRGHILCDTRLPAKSYSPRGGVIDPDLAVRYKIYVDCPVSAPPALYLCRDGTADRDTGRYCDCHFTCRYFPVYRYPGCQYRLAIQRTLAGRNGESDSHELRTLDHIQRYRQESAVLPDD